MELGKRVLLGRRQACRATSLPAIRLRYRTCWRSRCITAQPKQMDSIFSMNPMPHVFCELISFLAGRLIVESLTVVVSAQVSLRDLKSAPFSPNPRCRRQSLH
jgi:hypothetical protein